jgi:hypothetical protein
MYHVESPFGFGQLYLLANAREQEARNATEVGMQATIQMDFLALFT